MNRVLHIYSMVLLPLLIGCSGSQTSTPDPAQNRQLNAISPSAKSASSKGYLQTSYESWEQDAWEPTTHDQVSETDNEAQAPHQSVQATEPAPSDLNSSNTFTLQHYYDKWKRYLDKKENERTGPTHTERLETMPVIGNE